MLEVGNGGLSLVENKAHFSFWALLASPLMAGNDLQAMTPEIRDILTNRDVIAVNQDPLGMPGRKVRDDGPREVWVKPLADGSKAVIAFNRGTEESGFPVFWEDIGLAPGTKALVRDLWRHEDFGVFTGRYDAAVAPHGVAMVKVTPQP
jgi:alpha-galactosidase